MATVYSRTWASGKVRWYTKFKAADGQWKPLLLKTAKTKPQAQKLADELEKNQERAAHGLPAASPFVGNFCDLCWWAYKNHFSKQGSAQSDGSRFRTNVGDPEKGTLTTLGALLPRQVTSAKLAQHFTAVQNTTTVRGKPPSAGSINRLRAQFATVFELAKEHGYWFGENPVHGTKERTVIKAGFDILEPHEVKPTLDACDPYWRGCLAVGILAALRKGELFGLQKRDVDLPRRVLMVKRSHQRQTTKNGTHAAVPIHEALVPYLEEWMATPGPWLFPSHTGGQRSHQVDLPRILQMAMVRAGFIDRWEMKCRRKGCGHQHDVPHQPGFTGADWQPAAEDCPDCGFRLWATPRARKIRWHEGTRHTGASHLLMNGASLAAVQKILRHQSPTLTTETYGHLSTGFLKGEVDLLQLPGFDVPEAIAPIEPPPRAVHSASPHRGAPMVRGAKTAVRARNGKGTIQHQKSPDSSWSRGVSNPGPMHCEGKGEPFAVAPPVGTPSQVLVSVGTDPSKTSTPRHPVTPVRPDRGAPMVRGSAPAHHEPKNANAGGSGRTAHDPADLLTVQQVADRLSVGRTWVRRRLESGELTGIRQHHAAPLMVSGRQLAAYLERFPGIVPRQPAPVAPEATAAAARGDRKGAA